MIARARRSWSAAAVAALTAATLVDAGCSQKKRTEVMVGIVTDLHAPVPLSSIHLRVLRVPELLEVFASDFDITGIPGEGHELPATFGIYSESGESYRVRVILRATDNNRKELVTRTALLNLVTGRTVFLRLGLVSACVGKTDCSEGATCIDGRCESEVIDAPRLPDYTPQAEKEVSCASATTYTNTTTGEALAMGAGCEARASCQEGVCLSPPMTGPGDGGNAAATGGSTGSPNGGTGGLSAGGAGSGNTGGTGPVPMDAAIADVSGSGTGGTSTGIGGGPPGGGTGGASSGAGGRGGTLGAGTGGGSPSGSGGGPGSGGSVSPGSGGAAGTGGVPRSGGAPGSGGSTNSGGVPGSGGTAASGGAPGSGGAISSGGATGSGGAPGSGGANSGGASSGGAPGSGGSASGGAPGSGGSVGPSCPGTMGPSMVRVPEGYCIDSTEVTRAQYDAWLATTPPPSADPRCTSNATYAPAATPAACVVSGTQPVVCVDWCDAFSFCQAAGKRLCGGIGGGANLYANYADFTVDQWYNACTAHGALAYPYGAAYGAMTCNGFDNATGMTSPVGSMAGCQSPQAGYQGVFDLSGNAWEWEDSCVDDSATASCRFRGGSYGSSSTTLRCNTISQGTRGSQSQFVGFRCCAD